MFQHVLQDLCYTVIISRPLYFQCDVILAFFKFCQTVYFKSIFQEKILQEKKRVLDENFTLNFKM